MTEITNAIAQWTHPEHAAIRQATIADLVRAEEEARAASNQARGYRLMVARCALEQLVPVGPPTVAPVSLQDQRRAYALRFEDGEFVEVLTLGPGWGLKADYCKTPAEALLLEDEATASQLAARWPNGVMRVEPMQVFTVAAAREAARAWLGENTLLGDIRRSAERIGVLEEQLAAERTRASTAELLNASPKRARGCAAALLRLVDGFALATPEARSAWLAAVLTPIARRWGAFKGGAPLFAFAGDGRTLLIEETARIATGRRATWVEAPRSYAGISRLRFEHEGGLVALRSVPTITNDLEGELVNGAGDVTWWTETSECGGLLWAIERRSLFVNLTRAPAAAEGTMLAVSCLEGTQWGPCDTYGSVAELRARMGISDLDAGELEALAVGDVHELRIDEEGRSFYYRVRRVTAAELSPVRALAAAVELLALWQAEREQGARAHALQGWTGTWAPFEEWSDVVRGAVLFAGFPDPATGPAAAVRRGA